MNWSPFLEIFVGLFLALGVALGFFTRIRVWWIGLGVGLFVFARLFIAERFVVYDPRDVSAEDLWFYELLASFAAVPALVTAMVGRFFKRRGQS